MLKAIKKLIFFICLLLLAEVCYTQQPGNNLHEAEVFSGEDGLSSSRITVNFVDSRGYLWIGTIDGLNRYDGYNFLAFKHEPGNSYSISNNYIICIEEDLNGNLWVGTQDGLNLFDRKLGHFQEIVFSYPDDEENKPTRIDGIIEPDSTGIWIRVENFLKRIDLEDLSVYSFQVYEQNLISYKDHGTSGLVMDVSGFIWVGTSEGLFVFNPKDESTEQFVNNSLDPFSLSDNNVNDIFRDTNDEIWIATDNGLNKFDRLHNRFINYHNVQSDLNSKFRITEIFEAEDGTIWLASDLGLANLNKSSKLISIQPQIIFRKNLYNLSSVKALVIDKNNIAWFGADIGLIKIDLKPRIFDMDSNVYHSDSDLFEKSITAVYKDSEDRIWLGDDEGILEMADTQNDKASKFILENNWVKTIFEDSKGRIWIGCSNNIFIYSVAKNEIIAFEDYFDSPVGADISKLTIFQIIQGKREDFWIGTNNGLFHFKEKINTLDSYDRIYNDQTSVKVGSVQAICSNTGKEIWIGTHQGILVFNTESNVFYRPDFGFEDNSILDEIEISSILLDKENIWWIGTNYGLWEIDVRNGQKYHYSEKNGLPNNSVYKILEDRASNIWFSTNKGLVKYDKSRQDFLSYGMNDGLKSNEYNPGSGSASIDGELFFGGLRGVDCFYPHELREFIDSPDVLITGIEIYGQDGLKKKYLDLNTYSVEVLYNETFNIHFSVMDFSFPEQNRFLYSISAEGKREEWWPIGTQNSLTFSNLLSGTYTFKIRGSSGNGLWSENEASLKIIVEAPLWRTPIAFFIYGTLILFLFYIFIQLRTGSLRKSNRVLREHDIAAKEVSKQKELLSYRNKNIEDSLNYAQRIQEAILVTKEKFTQMLPNSFILHLPKDIVSGDFYWISEKENKVLVAAVDCTGHGVPGAFMSLIGLELFRKIIHLPDIEDPGMILNHLNDNIQEIFGKGGNISLRDGMDLSLCIIDKEKMTVQFAGAMNPLFLLRSDKLIEVKGDRFSIGADADYEESYNKKFTSHKIKLQKDDMIYMFSDGFADQFGGPAGKKYKYRRFRHLLLTIYNLEVGRQKQYLQESIEDWRGNEEQIDDILVIGIKADFNND